MFKNAKIKRKNRTLNYASGKIKTYGTYYTLKSDDYVDLYCEDHLTKRSLNQLVVLIASKKYNEYLKNISTSDR